MDMRIAGSGKVASGEYEDVRISGSGRLEGLVRCNSFHSSGSSKGEAIECKNEFKVSGSSGFSKDVRAGAVSASGAFSCGGNLTVSDVLRVSGSVKCEGNVKSTSIVGSGSLSVKGDVEAETVKMDGTLHCGGLLNAEEIKIYFERGMRIGAIGGSKILICSKNYSKKHVRMPLFSALKGGGDMILVENAIEGDSIALENVKAQRVSGRVVAIGEDCEIELVQYSDQVEISPQAKVGKTEKI